MSLNSVAITGNLTFDAEMRGSGVSVLAFTVAVNDRRKNPQTDEWEDVANFIPCVIFGKRAQSLERYLTKGTKVAVSGKLRWSQWETDGQKRNKIEVVVDEIEFMSQRGDGSGATRRSEPRGGGGRVVGQGAYQPTLPTAQPAAGAYDEDIPF